MWEHKTPSRGFFSPDQKRQVELIFEVLMPGKADSPGATDAGAARYVDLLLAMEDATYYEIPAWRALYVAGLAMLSGACSARFGKALDQLDPAQRLQLVTDLARGKLAGFPDPAWQTRFFSVLRGHCIEGCFADPRWGGNQNRVAWSWYGYLEPARAFKRGKN